jgi:hypothetical protein
MQNIYTTKKKNRWSPIWKISDKDFINLVNNSKTTTQVLAHFDLKNKGGNNRTVKQRIIELELDTSHFMSREESSIDSRKVTKEIFKKEWLTEKSNKTRGHLKKYLLKFNLLNWECRDCNNNGNWNNKKLVLQLEHINGISDDNRLENLCFLCPNCHSQTDTFAGKSSKSKISIKNKKEKYNKPRPTKIIWPNNNTLSNMVLKYPLIKLSKKLNVSDNAIKKHCIKNNIFLPKIGYWQKQNALNKLLPR